MVEMTHVAWIRALPLIGGPSSIGLAALPEGPREYRKYTRRPTAIGARIAVSTMFIVV